MHVTEHLVNTQNLRLILLLRRNGINLTVEFLAVDLAKDVHCFDRVFHAFRLFVVHTVEEQAVTTLEKVRSPSLIIMLHHLMPERRQLAIALLFNASEAKSVIRSAFIVEVGSLHVHLESKCFCRELWALENITEICRAYHAIVLVLRLQLVVPKMTLL